MCSKYNDNGRRERNPANLVLVGGGHGGSDDVRRVDDSSVTLEVRDVLNEEVYLMSRLDRFDAVFAAISVFRQLRSKGEKDSKERRTSSSSGSTQ